MVSWWVDELRHRVVEVMGAWAAELRVVERAIATEWELDAAKVHLAKIEAVL